MKSNWQTKKLGEVGEYINGRAFKPTEWGTKGLPIIRIQNLNKDDAPFHYCYSDIEKRYHIHKGDILISWSASLGVYVWQKGKALLNQHIFKVNLDKAIIDQDYFVYIIRTKLEEMSTKTHGATMKHIIRSKFLNIEIFLPPLKTQKEIVAKLDEKFAKLKEAKELREKALADTEKILSQTLHEIFEDGKKKGWAEKTIEDLSLEIRSGFACGKQNEVSKGVVHLRTHNISLDGQINLDKIVQIPKNFVNEKIFTLRKGDVVFNNTNSVELVGKTILITEDLPYAFSNHLTRIRFNGNSIIPAWALYVFQKFWSDKIFEKMCTRWIGQAGINQTSLSKIKILVPPLAEQKEIVAKLDKLSEKLRSLKELQKTQLEDLKKLEKTYLREAFNGELV